MIVAARDAVIMVAGTRGIIGDIGSAKIVMSALAGRISHDGLAR